LPAPCSVLANRWSGFEHWGGDAGGLFPFCDLFDPRGPPFVKNFHLLNLPFSQGRPSPPLRRAYVPEPFSNSLKPPLLLFFVCTGPFVRGKHNTVLLPPAPPLQYTHSQVVYFFRHGAPLVRPLLIPPQPRPFLFLFPLRCCCFTSFSVSPFCIRCLPFGFVVALAFQQRGVYLPLLLRGFKSSFSLLPALFPFQPLLGAQPRKSFPS